MLKIYKLINYQQNRSNKKIIIEDNVRNITSQMVNGYGF